MAICNYLLNPGRCRQRIVAIVAYALGLMLGEGSHLIAFADTIVTGIVTDETTGAAIQGATVVLTTGGKQLAQTATQSDGKYILRFEPGASHRILSCEIRAEHGEFDPDSAMIQVDSGNPDKLSYPLSLIPKDLGRCKQSVRGISVGHFEQAQFAEAITTTLNYSLRPEIQKVPSLMTFEPDIAACPNARPQSPMVYSRYAKVLNADILLGGKVDLQTGPKHAAVKIFVGDQYELFKPPRMIENKNVNLQDAEASQLNSRTNASILIAIARGLELDKRYQQCVDLLGVAERIDPAVGRESKPIRMACEAGLPNRALLRGRTP